MNSKKKIDYSRVLENLIELNTSVPPGENYGESINYLESLFEKVGCETETVNIPKKKAEGREGRVNLLAHRRNNGKPRLIFYSHIDVVPVQGWKGFKPKIKNGRLYGRGAADMKGAIPALLLALEKLERDNIDSKYDVSIVVTTDEEVGQASQLHYLKKFLEPVNNAYIFNLDTDFGFVTIASLGILQIKIKIKGKSVHSGLSHLGRNAVEDAVLAIGELFDLKKKVMSRKSNINANPATKLEKMEGRLNINVIEGGKKENVIPDECLFTIDRRLIPEENMDEAEEELIAALDSARNVNWEILNTLKVPSYSIDDPIVNELKLLIEEVTGESGKYGMMGSGDIYSVGSSWGAMVFGVGVIRPDSNIHGKNEFVRLKDIENLGRIIYEFLK